MDIIKKKLLELYIKLYSVVFFTILMMIITYIYLDFNRGLEVPIILSFILLLKIKKEYYIIKDEYTKTN